MQPPSLLVWHPHQSTNQQRASFPILRTCHCHAVPELASSACWQQLAGAGAFHVSSTQIQRTTLACCRAHNQKLIAKLRQGSRRAPGDRSQTGQSAAQGARTCWAACSPGVHGVTRPVQVECRRCPARRHLWSWAHAIGCCALRWISCAPECRSAPHSRGAALGADAVSWQPCCMLVMTLAAVRADERLQVCCPQGLV